MWDSKVKKPALGCYKNTTFELITTLSSYQVRESLKTQLSFSTFFNNHHVRLFLPNVCIAVFKTRLYAPQLGVLTARTCRQDASPRREPSHCVTRRRPAQIFFSLPRSKPKKCWSVVGCRCSLFVGCWLLFFVFVVVCCLLFVGSQSVWVFNDPWFFAQWQYLWQNLSWESGSKPGSRPQHPACQWLHDARCGECKLSRLSRLGCTVYILPVWFPCSRIVSDQLTAVGVRVAI